MADSHSERPITIDRNGTVHLGARTIAVPRTVSPEARQYLATPPWVMAVPPPNVPLWELWSQAWPLTELKPQPMAHEVKSKPTERLQQIPRVIQGKEIAVRWFWRDQ